MDSDKIEQELFVSLSDTGKDIRYIYHISDIHIHKTKRHEEYSEVIKNLHSTMSKQKNLKKSIVVCTGDVMHNKTEMGPEEIDLAHELFKGLAEYCPVLIIAGNHDCNLSNRDRMDALTPVLKGINSDDVHYLKNSGIYRFNNIAFGVTSIFDNDKILKAKKIKIDDVCKIALYHGVVAGSTNDLEYVMKKTTILPSHFNGYDYVLLGDIHKHQYLNEEKTIAYAGSLIQQDYGEKLTDHGILKWDLKSGESNLIEIPNDYGFIKLKINNGVLPAIKNVPRKPRIRLELKNTDNQQYIDLLEQLEKVYHPIEIIKTNEIIKIKKAQNFGIDITAKTDDIIKQYIKKKGQDEEFASSIVKLHNQLGKKNKSSKNNEGGTWQPLLLTFSNMLSYGENNEIDFRKFSDNSILGLIAPNQYGKSSILDIILFCIFDRSSRGERRDMMNKDKNKCQCKLTFSLDGNIYSIERVGTRLGITVKIDVNFIHISDADGNKINKYLNELEKNGTNRAIASLMGNYEDYITSSFSLQDNNNDLFNMSMMKRKEYLSNLLNLNIFTELHSTANVKFKELSNELIGLEKVINSVNVEKLSQEIKETQIEIEKSNDALEQHNNNNIITMMKQYLSENPELIKTEFKELQGWSREKLDNKKKLLLENAQYDLSYDKSIEQLSKEIDALQEKKVIEPVEIDILLEKNKIVELENDVIKSKKSLFSDIDIENAKKNSMIVEEINSLKNKLVKCKNLDDLKVKYKELSKECDRVGKVVNEKNKWIAYGENKIIKKYLFDELKSKYEQNLALIESEDDPWEALALIENEIEKSKNNRDIEKKINNLEKQLIECKTVREMQESNLYLERNIQSCTLKCENIKNTIDQFQKLSGNKEINKQLDKEIRHLREEKHVIQTNMETIEEIKRIDRLIMLMDKKEVDDEYYNSMYNFNKTCQSEIKINDDKIVQLEKKLAELNMKLSIKKEDITKSIQYRKEYETVNRECLLYKSYVELTNSNGIPYELLKAYLPIIESHINSILVSIVSFTVQFIFHDESLVAEQKEKNTKANVGSIDIHIINGKKMPRSVNLASGFEKFVISLSIRMALSQISLISKPDMIVIDEGWSCMDSENLNNIGIIMDYIKRKYMYTIVISHLSEIKGYVDHPINIDIIDGFSKVN